MVDAELEALRAAIDDVDHRLLELIRQRIALVLQVGDYKRARGLAVYDPARERALLTAIGAAAEAPLTAVAARRVFERVVDESRHLEQSHVNATR